MDIACLVNARDIYLLPYFFFECGGDCLPDLGELIQSVDVTKSADKDLLHLPSLRRLCTLLGGLMTFYRCWMCLHYVYGVLRF